MYSSHTDIKLCTYCLYRHTTVFIHEIHQLWQSGVSRVYSNSCCSCSFGAEIIKIDQSFHKMYNIVNFQESRTILNDCTKRYGNLLKAPFFLIFSEHPWDKLRVNLTHLQFLPNNCVYSSNTDIKLCTYCLYRHTTVFIHDIYIYIYIIRRENSSGRSIQFECSMPTAIDV